MQEIQASSSGTSSQSQQPSLNDCLKLLRGERDEQRLAGLLLVTKFCSKDDHAAIRKVYDAVGAQFLYRLLRTGMGKGEAGGGRKENRDAYLQLSITVLSAFCRVPEIAASEDVVTKIPLILEVMSQESVPPLLEECYEILLLVSRAHEGSVMTLYTSGILEVLTLQMPSFPDGSHLMELAMLLIQLIVSKLPEERVYSEHATELSLLVVVIAKQFAMLQNALKFEALYLLSSIMSNKYSAPVHDALCLISNDAWPTNLRIGIVDILQNRVAPTSKFQALVLAECVMSIVGEGWLIGEMNLPNAKYSLPADRCVMLVLESARVEVDVILNELGYLKYEAPKDSLSTAEDILVKQRNLGVTFSLLEKVIKFVSSFAEAEEPHMNSIISESTFSKIIFGLNKTTDVVLDYLKDAKVHELRKGDDLLASVRIIGSYLAEAPDACREKVIELLDFMLSVEGEMEHSPFYSICFLLPMLCQLTVKTAGCKVLTSSGAFRSIVGCLIILVNKKGYENEDDGSILLACDTILNVLLKREQIQFSLDDPSFVKLLEALSYWTEDSDDQQRIMMASSICSLILGATSEAALLNHPEFDIGKLSSLSKLIKRSLTLCGQGMTSSYSITAMDLDQIISSGYSQWVDRFPHIREAVES
ncbi:PREDICTED: neurochondrin isoform X1 [Ipomoea nil]|uniref:neurochondrin isoform X1 n=1 Tax=Ipomoea nil TaxID=35883 RepID=UPI00090185A6|nr:PREDICTED: neurochondrin isoform X1 [Ipomoea nil]